MRKHSSQPADQGNLAFEITANINPYKWLTKLSPQLLQQGYTALTCASEEGHTAVVELLLRCPAIDINLPTEVHIPIMNVFPTG